MNGQFNYIDRQQSQVTGNSEKSQKVHCANWKEEVHLRKKLELLTRQKNGSIKHIFSEQKIVAIKFRRNVYRSIELIKTHEDLKCGMASKNGLNQPKYYDREASGLKLHTKEGSSHLIKRPVTASELHVRAWDRKILKMNSKLQRVHSAPIFRKNNANTNSSKSYKTSDLYSASAKYKEMNLNRDVKVISEKEAFMNFMEKIKQLK